MAFVYLITCNNLSYVGVAVSPERRLREHRKSDTYLGRALRKHGLQSMSILHSDVSWEEALQLEIREIADRGTKAPGGYNLTGGGEGCLGLSPSPKAREGARQRMIARNAAMSPEERRAHQVSAAKAGAGWSNERKAAHVERTRRTHAEGRIPTAPMREAARFWSEERKAAHSERLKVALGGGKGWSPERRAAQAERMRRLRAVRSQD